MGEVHPGIPLWGIEFAKEMGIDEAVETGSATGNSAFQLSINFESVESIESNYLLWREASSRNMDRVKFHHGTSNDLLAKILHNKVKRQLFWLDAHFSGSHTDGLLDPCPLLQEIEILGRFELLEESLILIDDARLLCMPHDLAPQMVGWPKLVEVLQMLEEYRLNTFLYEDVVVGVPQSQTSNFMTFMLPHVVARQRKIYEFYSQEN